MPHQHRLDIPGLLQHVIVRGIERRNLFRTNVVRRDFFKRPSKLLAETGTVSVSLTDARSGYNAVVLTIKEIGVVASNTATNYYNSSQLDNLPLTVSILDFPEEATLHLADIAVDLPKNGEPVCFKQIRPVLAAEGGPDCPGAICNYVIETGTPTPYELKTPSGPQSGVKILNLNDFRIDANNDTIQISGDFDPATARTSIFANRPAFGLSKAAG